MTEAATPRETVPPVALREGEVGRARSLWADAFRRLIRNPGSVAGAVILLLLILIALFAPYATPYDPI